MKFYYQDQLGKSNGEPEVKNGRSRSTSKHSDSSYNGTKHRGGRDHEKRTDDEEESDLENGKQLTNGNTLKEEDG